jgi:exodeoxyribonuclease VII small subunit
VFKFVSIREIRVTLVAPLTVHSFHWTDQWICSNFRFVPNATRNAGQNTPAKADSLPFEEALEKLETIVQAMESEELPLETLLGKYAEGTLLAKVCQDKLAEAELKIQQLEKNTAGEMKLKPLPINEQTE